MDTALYVSGALFAVFSLISAIVGTLGHRSLSIWTGLAAFCFIGLAGACWLQDREWQRDVTKRRFPRFNERVDEYRFTLGSGIIAHKLASELKAGARWEPIVMGDKAPITLYVENGEFFADFNAALLPGEHPIKLRHNELQGKPHGWDMNSNDSALEIVDENGAPVFQMVWADSAHIIVKGDFVLNTMRMTFPPVGSPIFKYPAWKFPSELAP
ncbi:MAG: hypothetical protein DME97_11450 [Verrucomicrobia bacterium]|nr:MAG: hypothetical protein DME97_11450 [Verrucomicrobiota bacterium]